MRRSKDFRRTTRRGLRASRPTLVVHVLQLEKGHLDEPSVGFVVSGAVGNAVTRNRVKRRLRHLAAAHISADRIAADGIGIVVRALPRAATNPAEVPADFGSAWHEAMSRLLVLQPTGRSIR
jgi:ribonuclease P protein component